MVRTNRQEMAARLAALAPWIQCQGVRHLACTNMPSHWRVERRGLTFILTKGALLSPLDNDLSTLLDLWDAQHRKVASLRLFSARFGGATTAVTVPAEIISFHPGDWLLELPHLEAEARSVTRRPPQDFPD